MCQGTRRGIQSQSKGRICVFTMLQGTESPSNPHYSSTIFFRVKNIWCNEPNSNSEVNRAGDLDYFGLTFSSSIGCAGGRGAKSSLRWRCVFTGLPLMSRPLSSSPPPPPFEISTSVSAHMPSTCHLKRCHSSLFSSFFFTPKNWLQLITPKRNTHNPYSPW